MKVRFDYPTDTSSAYNLFNVHYQSIELEAECEAEAKFSEIWMYSYRNNPSRSPEK